MTEETIDPRTLDLSSQKEYNRVIYSLEKALRAVENNDKLIAKRLIGILIALGYTSYHLNRMGSQARMAGREYSRVQHLLEFFHVRQTRYATNETIMVNTYIPNSWMPFIEEGKILLILGIEAEKARLNKTTQVESLPAPSPALVVTHAESNPPSIAPSETDDSDNYKKMYQDMVYVIYGLCFVCGLLLIIVGTHAKEWFK